MGFPVLSSIVFLPLLGALIISLLPGRRENFVRGVAIFFSALSLGLVIFLLLKFNPAKEGMQFVEKITWIKEVGISYYLGVDGISIALLLITALLSLIAILASWEITYRLKEYFFLILLLETGMLGVFVSLDYVLFYIFWEVVLVPMYFLIGIWGGPRREYAALKFFIYTLLGSALMLLAILGLYFYSGLNTFDMLKLANKGYPLKLQTLLFLGFYASFAVKVPLFPFHTWLPDAHVEAPTPVSAILAGVLLKMGGYGFLRISMPTFPEAFQRLLPYLAILATVNIVYGAYVAMAQRDLKKLVAYSSISHMGYVILGLTALNAAGLNGATFQMFSHGLTTGMLFLLVGIIHHRTHTRQIAELGGLQAKAPLLGGIFAFVSFASLGLPGLSGFVGEFLVLLGAFQALFLSRVFVILAVLTLVLTAGYILWMFQRVSWGASFSSKELADLRSLELAYLSPLIILILLLGIYPPLLLRLFNPTVVNFLKLWGF